jgi:chitinase
MYAKGLALAALAASPVVADYAVNAYWGQVGGDSLASYCESDGFDYVTIAFIINSPEQDPATGYPGTNFGAHCSAEFYDVDGNVSGLNKNCQQIIEGIPACQANGKKVLLSIGGAFVTGVNYTVSSQQNGEDFADFLWGAFGPYDASWTGPRPFDSSATEHVSVDGFDFDIETKFADQSGYVALINRLHTHFDESAAAAGTYVVSGAPQCPLNPDYFQMQTMITDAVFDLLFIQFYNNPSCDAIVGNAPDDSFNYDAWVDFLADTASSNAKLFIGLPGSPAAAGSGYLEPSVAYNLLQQYKTHASFGGASVWDVDYGSNKTANGRTYIENLHDALNDIVVPVPVTVCTETYTVQAGDYCYAIAVANGISVDDLEALNPTLDDACDLVPGQVLCVAVGTAATTTSSTSSAATSTSSSSSSSISSTSSSSVHPATTTSIPLSTGPVVTGPTVTGTGFDSSVLPTVTGPYNNSTSSATIPLSTGTGSSDPTTSLPANPTAPFGNSTAGVSSTVDPIFTSEPATLTTSTLYSTIVETVTSCAPTVTNCPAGPHVTTKTIAIGTTVCPVSANPTVPVVVLTATVVPISNSPAPTGPAQWTTSTVYSTTVYTITSCAPTVTNCPAGPHVTTEIIAVGTTVCPVSGGAQPTGPAGAVQTSAFTTVVKPSASVPVVAGNPFVPSGAVSSGVPVPSSNGTVYVPTYTPVQPSPSSTATTPASVPPVSAGAARNAAALVLPAVLMAAVFAL